MTNPIKSSNADSVPGEERDIRKLAGFNLNGSGLPAYLAAEITRLTDVVIALERKNKELRRVTGLCKYCTLLLEDSPDV